MKLIFSIDYRTNWGEELWIVGNSPSLGNNDEAGAVRMTFEESLNRWSAEVDIPDTTESLEYRYFVRTDDGTNPYIKREWGKPHKFLAGKGISVYSLMDRWQDMPYDKPFFSSAFTECINRRPMREKAIVAAPGTITIYVKAPMIPPSMSLAISGEAESLGAWNPSKAIRLDNSKFPVWAVNLSGSDLKASTEYKFLMLDTATGEPVAWENGNNRTLGVSLPDMSSATVISGLRFINPNRSWKGAGVAIPVFSVRSEQDFGVGDFADLRLMIDWAVKTGQKFLQILPINDTTMTHTWTDSYPYNANSTFALHPMFLRLEELGTLKDAKKRKKFEKLAKELNSLDTVDYERVNNAKTEYTREIFAQDGAATLQSEEYKAFLAKNSEWLLPYAAFCTLRDKFSTPEFSKWGEYAVYTPEVLKKVLAESKDETDYVCYIQYHLDKQMRKVHEYAREKGVALKGDIPIGISRTSADAWTNPRLFNLDCQAGAPPDDFSVLGQNWGLPTYNWDEMSLDGFAWWKSRFRKMSEYFDAYRIDHVLGFFRIWEIPMDAIHGLLGTFNPALPFTVDELRYNYDFWLDPGRHTKPYIADDFLPEFFGPYTTEAKSKYLKAIGDGRYRLKKDFNTQRKIADHFAALEKNEKNSRVCDALLGLVDNVLFIEDPREYGKYHPRISAQFTYVYRSLSDYERWCFDRLYNDFFYHRHNDFWYDKAMWKLPALTDATDMLVCAEDLGMIPACVPAVMNQLHILSLEIQRMPKNPGSTFGDTWSYPYFSVCTTSTHDMGGIRQWWEENRDKTQQFFNNVLRRQGQAPYFAEPWICEQIVDQHLLSPSMLCILPLQDWLSTDAELRRKDPREEQINEPSHTPHYWRYRMHLTMEQLLKADDFNKALRDKNKGSGR